MIYTVNYNRISLTFTSAKSAQHACRLAFSFWIREGIIKRQPPSDSNWPSSFRGVVVDALSRS